jgi:hypothetical protein
MVMIMAWDLGTYPFDSSILKIDSNASTILLRCVKDSSHPKISSRRKRLKFGVDFEG